MKFRVVLPKTVQKSLGRLPDAVVGRILTRLAELETNPRPADVKKLKGREAWRIRVGDYRVIYEIHDRELQVLVITVRSRHHNCGRLSTVSELVCDRKPASIQALPAMPSEIATATAARRCRAGRWMAICRVLYAGALCWLAGCAVNPRTGTAPPVHSFQSLRSDPALLRRVLALNPERITSRDVAGVLSKCPAPQILNFNGSAFRTMDGFSGFLMDMGYPEKSVRNPAGGALSRGSYLGSGKVAREVAAAWRDDGLRPMLIGHSQGGSFVMEVLHSLEGRPVCYAAAIATGQWMRVALGQWGRIAHLRKVPDSVEEFSGYRLADDFLGSDVPGLGNGGDYRAEGRAKVHNVQLHGTGHIEIVNVRPLAADSAARRWMDAYGPGARSPQDARLLFAADVWHYVTKHWCLELQRTLRR